MSTEDPKRQVIDVEVLEPEEQRGSASRRNYAAGPGFAYTSFNTTGCLIPFITLFLFGVLLGQYGLLAAIGFLVFHIIGSILGTLRLSRQLVLGFPMNPWPWRIGNWCVSFILTVWLAGGFN